MSDLTLDEKLAAVRMWVDTGIGASLEEDPSGFMLGVASVGVLAVLDEVAAERKEVVEFRQMTPIVLAEVKRLHEAGNIGSALTTAIVFIRSLEGSEGG